MASITGSVGQGGQNQPADVRQVQAWLNAKLGGNLATDGACGPQTVAAIKAFQAGVRGVTAPDGLISPNGPTLLALASAAARAQAASASAMPNFPGATTQVVDLSHNNGNLPDGVFATLKAAGVGAVILKASQGAGFRDPLFAARLASAQAAGLLVAAYHFGTGEAVDAQLNNFFAAVSNAGGNFSTLIGALDLEPNPSDTNHPPAPPSTMSLDQGEAWVAGYKARAGATPLIYGGANYLGANGGGTGRPNLAACPLWVAAYPNTPGAPAALTGWGDWALWQYTDGRLGCYAGPVAGLTCDQSIFRGDTNALSALWQSLTAPASVA